LKTPTRNTLKFFINRLKKTGIKNVNGKKKGTILNLKEILRQDE
jgi:hypothetical protein